MFIDFHTHIFPDKIANAAISELSQRCGSEPFADGTLNGLLASMKNGGVDISVVLPVVTNPKQFDSINRFAKSLNEVEEIVSFGGIHPDCESIEAKLDFIKEIGLKGIKIHPDYQKTFIDDPKYVKIISHCIEIGLYVITHSGLDVGYPDPIHCTPQRILNLLSQLPEHEEPRLILAHTGAFDMWDEVEEKLVGKNVYFDLAYCLDKISEEQLMRIINNHGSDKILFATDSPWSGQKEFVEIFNSLPLNQQDKENISYKNATKILSLKNLKALKR
ncbi:MAG: amidohydrolase family protein [Clostridia bacterium]|nr:amidohydrolase family protein [Clostridia bacterium]